MVLQLPLPLCQKKMPVRASLPDSVQKDAPTFSVGGAEAREDRHLGGSSGGLLPAGTCVDTGELSVDISMKRVASIQRIRLAFRCMRLRPLQAVNLSKALQSARLGRIVSHPVRSVDLTMLRKIMRLTRCEHSALQKRPITVHPACAARRRACLSATLLQL